MAKNTQLTAAVANAQGDALSALLNNGYLRIYTGSQPSTADTALGAQTLLSEHRFSATAAAAASAGVVTFNAITSATASASGTATWYRALKSDGTTVVMDGNVDVSANTPNLVIANTSIASGMTVSITSFTHTVNKSTSGL